MKYGKTDSNQHDIVEAIRDIGADVKILSDVGEGFPDLLVGFRGVNYLVEVKTAGGKLRKGQKVFLAKWRGQAAVARSVDEVLRIMGVI